MSQGSRPRGGWVILVAVLAVSAPVAASVAGYQATPHRLEQTIDAPAEGDPGAFGKAVAVDGDRMVVGDRIDDSATYNSGAVHVYARADTAWVHRATLSSSDSTMGERFGKSVALDGDRILVGNSPSPDSEASKQVYLFERQAGEWVETATLTPPNSGVLDGFASQVGLFGEWAFVGAEREDDWRGAVYVYHQDGSGWLLEQRLAPEILDPWNAFGGSGLEVEADLAVIGSGGRGAFTFELVDGTWVQTSRLTGRTTNPPDGTFGCCFDLDADRLAISSSSGVPVDLPSTGAEEEPTARGTVHLFEREAGSWVKTDVLFPPAPVKEMGRTVALDGDRVAVKAVFLPGQVSEHPPVSPGPVPWQVEATDTWEGFFVFEQEDDGSWTRSVGVDEAGLLDEDGFEPVAWSGDEVVVSAPRTETGNVYTFAASESPEEWGSSPHIHPSGG